MGGTLRAEEVPVNEFAGLVDSFISLVDGYRQYELLDFLEELNLLLPKLYAGTVKLPEVYDDEDVEGDQEAEEDEESELELAPETPESKLHIC